MNTITLKPTSKDLKNKGFIQYQVYVDNESKGVVTKDLSTGNWGTVHRDGFYTCDAAVHTLDVPWKAKIVIE